MPPRPFSDLDIQMQVVPTSANWPGPDVARTIAWDRLRDAVSQLRTLVKTVDAHCRAAESDHDLSAEGIARRRSDHGRQALTELEHWPPLVAAEQSVTKNIADLEARMTALPGKPETAVDALLHQEIRAHIKAQKNPVNAVLGQLANPVILGAVLHAPAFLSGLNDTELQIVRDRARIALHPEQAALQDQLRQALDDLRKGIESTKRTLRTRCEVPALQTLTKQPA